jgi:uncharacterized protein
MSEVVVTVRGERERRVAPELAVVQLAVRAEGAERGVVVERATSVAEPLHDDLRAHQESGEVAEWSSSRVSAWSERPWNAEGRQLPPVHHAVVEISATFRDFSVLSWWAVQVVDVRWDLSPASRAHLEREVATEAVGTAVERATAYAEALGFSVVTPLEIADAGMLDTRPQPESGPRVMRAMAADAASTGLSLQPADIVVSAAVEARFRAR